MTRRRAPALQSPVPPPPPTLPPPHSPAPSSHLQDIIERDGSYLVRCDVPGMAADDLSIQLHEGVLSISGKKKHSAESRDEVRWPGLLGVLARVPAGGAPGGGPWGL